MLRLPHPRFLLFLVVFAATAAFTAPSINPESAIILGFDVAAALFLATSVPLWLAADADNARAAAIRDDGGRFLLLLSATAVLSVITVALTRMMQDMHQMTGLQFSAVICTLVLAWMFANLVFSYHYAQMYYDQKDGDDAGGISLPDNSEPVFADFVYFAFTIGMTCQTADIAINSRRIRRVATLQGLFAFFFNLGVLALCVNVLSGIL
jgi:uncharacterized membrane protein